MKPGRTRKVGVTKRRRLPDDHQKLERNGGDAITKQSRDLLQSELNSSQSAHLPDDIILNILDKLPLRSLCRFMCVSKSWGSLILNHFTSQPRSPILGILCSSFFSPVSESDPNMYLSSIDTYRGILTTHASTPIPDQCSFEHCNGLFCYTQEIGLDDDFLTVWDSLSHPTTTHVLPKTSFSQSQLYVRFNLGFDPLSNTYKVLVSSQYPNCEIYTLPTKPSSTSHWRPITDTTNVGITFLCPNNACIRSQSMLYWYTLQDSIVSFDFSTETFGTAIPLPHGVNHQTVKNLFELDDCLCLLNHHRRVKTDFWMLKDNNAWVMMASVLPPSRSASLSLMYPTTSTRKGDFSLMESFDYHQKTMTLYFYNFFTCQFNTTQLKLPESKEFHAISK